MKRPLEGLLCGRLSIEKLESSMDVIHEGSGVSCGDEYRTSGCTGEMLREDY